MSLPPVHSPEANVGPAGDPRGATGVTPSGCALLEALPEGAWMVDAEGGLLEVNGAYLRRTGYAREELRGRGVGDLEVGLDPATLRARLRTALEGTPVACEVQHRDREGHPWPVEVRFVAWPDSPGRVLVVTRDLTAVRWAEETRKQREEELATLAAFRRVASRGRDLAEATAAGLEALFGAVQPEVAFLFLRSGDQLALAGILPAAARAWLEPGPEHRVGECLCGLALQDGRPVYSRDLRTEARCPRPECREAGLRSFAALPLVSGDEVLGVIGMGTTAERDFAVRGAFLEVLAGQVAAAVAQARLLEAARRELAERQRTEAALRESARWLDASQRLAGAGHYVLDLATGTWTASAALLEVFGIGPERERDVALWAELLHPDDRQAMLDYFAQHVLAGRNPFDREYRIVRPGDGSTRWVHGWGELVLDAAGQPVQMFGTIQDRTERRQAEDALRRSEQQYRELVENSNSIILRWNSRGEVTFLNEFGQRFFGYPAEDILGRNLMGTIVPETESTGRGLRALLEQISADPGAFENNVNENMRRDRSRVWIAWTNRAVFGTDRRIAEIFSVGTDITRLKRAEEAVQENEEKFRALFDHAPDAVFILDGDWRFLDANRAACDHLQYSREELLVRSPLDIEVTEVAARVPPQLAAARELGYARFESLHRRRDGTVVPVEVSAQRFEHRGRTLWFSICRNLTERRRSEQLQAAMLRIAEAALTTPNLAELFESIHRVIAELMPARNFFIALLDSAAGVIRFPYLTDECGTDESPISPGRGLTGHVLRTGEPLWVDRAAYARLVAQGEVEAIGPPPMDWVGVPLKTPRGASIGVMAAQTYREDVRLTGADRDVLVFVSTQVAMAIERKQAEEALHRTRADLERAQAAAHIGTWTSVFGDPERLDWSAETRRIFGCEAGGFDGRNQGFFDRIHPDDLAAVRAAAAAARAGEKPYEIEHRIVRPDGTVRWVYQRAEVERAADGRPLRMVGVVQDITERKQLEARLLQSQKMEAVGQLAGGVAHDFNNILAAILMQLSLLRSNPSLDAKARDLVEELERGAQRSANLTRQLLMFGRRSVMQLQAVDLNELLAELQKMLRRLLGEHIAVELSGEVGLPGVQADPVMLQQVILNLCVNARDAMPRGGRLTLRTRTVSFSEEQVPGVAGARAGDFVCLSVGDTGQGMDAPTLQHIFEPFFTTKEVGRGTGLGLATVHGIVEQHQGWVEVASAVGEGSTFRVYLPAQAGPEPAREPPPAALPLPGGQETVLLVEDEPAVRQAIAGLLRAWGYQVIEARDGVQAEVEWRRHQGAVDLLFTDLVMPGGLGGLELAERLQAEDPALRVILSSGYSADLVQQGRPVGAGVTFLPKPWLPATLATTVRRSLDLRPPRSAGRNAAAADPGVDAARPPIPAEGPSRTDAAPPAAE